MADTRISDLTAQTGVNIADDDELVMVNTSEGQTKRLRFDQLLQWSGLDVLSSFDKSSSTLSLKQETGGISAQILLQAGPDEGPNTGIVVTTARLAPSVLQDNTKALGGSNRRFSEVYAGNATINTSDARLKQDVLPIDDALLDAWEDVNLVTFRWIASVQEKGDASRLHTGVIAQQVKEAMENRGLDPTRYSLLCYDKWDAEDEYKAGDRWSIRYEEALIVEAAYQRRRSDRMEQRLARLESLLAGKP